MKSKLKFSIWILKLIVSLLLAGCGSSTRDLPGNSPQSERVLCAGGRSENSDGYGGGDGTRENPYLICTVNHFRTIQGDMGRKRFFKLTADLNFANEGNIRIIALAPFASIDGQNHRLQNITMQHGYGFRDNGIFGQLVRDMNGNQDEIKNLVVENVTLLGDGNEDGGGVIASTNWGGIISNVHVTGRIQIQYPNSGSSTWSVGGLVGRNTSVIENSSFDGDIIGTSNVGGIAGINEGTIRNSMSSGTISGHSGIGGVVGLQLRSGVLETSRSTSGITANRRFGAVTGIQCDSDEIQVCVSAQ